MSNDSGVVGQPGGLNKDQMRYAPEPERQVSQDHQDPGVGVVAAAALLVEEMLEQVGSPKEVPA